MKAVIWCGGLGMRMREYSERVPKPLVPIGPRPLVWHMLQYYSRHGVNEFILALGYGAEEIKRYFLSYEEWVSNDFVLTGDGQVELLAKDIEDWRITFVDTGLHSTIAERLVRVRDLLAGERMFFANYADSLTNCDIWSVAEHHEASGATATFMAVHPTRSFHVVEMNGTGIVTGLSEATSSNVWVNGGYMVLSEDIFDYIEPGDELVEQPFQRLLAQGKLAAHTHSGAWAAVDTFKERQEMEDLYLNGRAFWETWRTDGEARQRTEQHAG